jgi:hypothetical protein
MSGTAFSSCVSRTRETRRSVSRRGGSSPSVLEDHHAVPGADAATKGEAAQGQPFDLQGLVELLEHGMGDPASGDRDHPVGAHGLEAQAPVGGDGELDLVPVVEGVGAGDHRTHRRVLDLPDAAQGIPDDGLFEAQLGLIGDVLEMTPPAGPEMGARRIDPLRRRAEHPEDPSPGIRAVVLHHLDLHLLPGDPEGDEDHLALMAADGLAAVGDLFQGQPDPRHPQVPCRRCDPSAPAWRCSRNRGDQRSRSGSRLASMASSMNTAEVQPKIGAARGGRPPVSGW